MFNTLTGLLTEKLGPLGPLYAVGILGVVFIALALPMLLKRKPDPLDRLKAAGATARQTKTQKKDADEVRLRHGSKSSEKLDKFATFLEPQDEEELTASRLKLLRAGYRSKSAVRTFHFAQFALGLGFLFLGVLYVVILSATSDVSMQKVVLSILVPGGAGYFLPKYWVERRVQSRQEQITNGFPDSLDMMLVCVEAGQSLDQSIIRVSKELRAGFPALAEEFEIVSYEIKAGKDKITVLKDMGERCGVMDISSFVTVLVQSATFGTSIADALRVYAGEMRDKRVMRAEEKANKLPTKLTLGTMMFTLPPLLIILIGPSVYGIAQMMGNVEF
ncbi:MAG: pilus assembly protein TadC [Confluentimicrobium sp.]|jgi:tight adherence protein C|uniref:type II secretion system F family protein n=1 Tax=Actibacterium sp. TaxID=1872125 RepID=UPI00050EBC51|nr:type II secretion system F family protein [Actibacterium sp.]KGB81177.1 pilus assembly protein TadC [Rhodovulum sp. NI22]MBC56146.1 pilus assembly protein TadC [Actibacterium sp.]MDY6858368.1 type II secretion system F family protein [Pseudomonadota bacterium]|tara:strand:- start:915 stop:1910 length:996 start_codon:yes stop_codon:yes gene_type:complete